MGTRSAKAPLQRSDRLFIGGEWVEPSTDSSFDVIDSGTEAVYYTIAGAGPDDMTRAISAARQSGARLQISHMQTKIGAPAYAGEHTLELIEAARRHDVDISFDVIPHAVNNTALHPILARRVRAGGTAKAHERLK